MKRSSRMTKILIVVVILIMGLTSTAAAEEKLDSKILESKLLENKSLEGRTLGDRTLNLQDAEKVKEISTQVVGKIKETTGKYAQTNISQKYTKSDNQVLGKIKIRYEDVNGNLLKSDVKAGIKLGDYTEKAIPIEGFKLVSKGSYTVALTEEKHEWLIVFKYQKADKDKEEPVDPENPDKEEPKDPDKEEPKDPDKEEPKEPQKPEKPKADDSKTSDSDNKEKAITTQAKLPKTGSPMTALYLAGGLVSLSGGILLRKKK